MAYEIVWTENAKEDLSKILDYLSAQWSEASVHKFLDTLYEKIELLAVFPFMGIVSEKLKEVRRLVITTQIVLFYRVSENNVILLDFFDVRQSPDKSNY